MSLDCLIDELKLNRSQCNKPNQPRRTQKLQIGFRMARAYLSDSVFHAESKSVVKMDVGRRLHKIIGMKVPTLKMAMKNANSVPLRLATNYYPLRLRNIVSVFHSH